MPQLLWPRPGNCTATVVNQTTERLCFPARLGGIERAVRVFPQSRHTFVSQVVRSATSAGIAVNLRMTDSPAGFRLAASDETSYRKLRNRLRAGVG